MTKIILALFLFVFIIGVHMGSASPMNRGRVLRDADAWKRYGGSRRRYSSGPNQALKQHGATKFATGAGLWALGAVTGNSGWQNTGKGLAKLGLATKLGAHIIPNFGK